MSLLYPTITVNRITEITKEMLDSLNVSALILDVDNTLTTHNNPQIDSGVTEWIKLMRQEKIKMMLVSNNSKKRIKPFAANLKIEYISRASKPLGIGYNKAIKAMKTHKRNCAAIGDQLFTDILGGNISGIKTILVEPMNVETGLLFRFKRKLEKALMRKYHNKPGTGVEIKKQT